MNAAAVWLFETPRLFARRLVGADAGMMHAVYGDAGNMRWVGDGRPLDRSQCVYWIEVTHRNYATRGYGMLALVARDSGDIVGFGGLVHPGGQPEAEIKYALRPEYHGMGFATEAAAGLLGYGAAVHGIRRVIATVAPGNLASQRVLQKAGMRQGELRRNDDGSFTQFFFWHADPSAPAGHP